MINHRLFSGAGLALVISLFSTALAEGFHLYWLRPLAVVTLLTGIGLLAPSLPRAGKAFVVVALGLMVITAIVAKDPWPLIYQALIRGAAFAGLMTALGLMREGAASSPLIRACGTHMIAQPPKLRYAVLAVGSHLFGLILNMGAMVMLSTMVMRAAPGTSDHALADLRRRRALTAVLRGFGTTSTWSPMAITPTVVLSTLPMLKWADIVPYSLILMAMFLVIGWIFDSFETRHLVRALQSATREPPPVGGWGMQARLLLLVAAILAVVITTEYALHASVTTAVMLATPLVGLLWMIIQTRRRRAGLVLWLRIKRLVLQRLPRESLETVMFSTSGIIGILLASLIEPAWIVALTRPLPHFIVPLLMFWAVLAAGQMGVSPVVSVVVIGGALGAPGVIHVSPFAMAAALTAGWSLTVAASPFTGPTLTLARISGTPVNTVSRGWNGRYTLAAVAAASVFIVAIALLKTA